MYSRIIRFSIDMFFMDRVITDLIDWELNVCLRNSGNEMYPRILVPFPYRSR